MARPRSTRPLGRKRNSPLTPWKPSGSVNFAAENRCGEESRDMMMARLTAKRVEIEAQLADPGVYADADKVKTLVVDQAYVVKELDQLESEWLQFQC